MSRHFGTRHRAAIGITEETDCLSIVVSEETGCLSVAAFGELRAGISMGDLAEVISQHFVVKRAQTTDHPPADHLPLENPVNDRPPALESGDRPHPGSLTAEKRPPERVKLP